jgi:signal transduction histidine kinase
VLRAEERDRLVELHVSDGGSGIPHEFRERAFDRFSRADEARSGGGSGLGLSIVELVAAAHGGGVGLSDASSGGADVWISLPLADTAERTPGTARPTAKIAVTRTGP